MHYSLFSPLVKSVNRDLHLSDGVNQARAHADMGDIGFRGQWAHYCLCGAFWFEYPGGTTGCPVANVEAEYAAALALMRSEWDAAVARCLANAERERASFEMELTAARSA